MIKYDIGELKRRVGARRLCFILLLCAGLLMIAAAAVIIVNFYEDGGWLLLGVAVGVAGFALVGVPYRIYRPAVLKSRTYYATVTRKHVFATADKQLKSAKAKYGVMILSDEGGKNHAARGLTMEQLSAYRDGDRVFHVGGTRFPIIIGREVEAQPCPICGTANRPTDDKCPHCRLDINEINSIDEIDKINEE